MDIISFEVIRFLIVGVANTLVGYLLFVGFYFLFDVEIVALFFAYVLGILFNYKTYSKYVFISRDRQVFVNFVFIYVSIFIFNSLMLDYFISEFMLTPYIAQFVSITIVIPTLYVLNKKYVFIKTEKD